MWCQVLKYLVRKIAEPTSLTYQSAIDPGVDSSGTHLQTCRLQNSISTFKATSCEHTTDSTFLPRVSYCIESLILQRKKQPSLSQTSNEGSWWPISWFLSGYLSTLQSVNNLKQTSSCIIQENQTCATMCGYHNS